jgi:dynein heavy chain
MLKLFLDATDDIPWESLNFVTGIINYGGRVTDDQDSRCIMTILEKFCNPKCLDENYKYTPSGTYFAPAEGKIDVYRDYVESLPMHDLPEIFGLHDNANITYQRSESNRIISTLLSI